ncbi:hypothetical protein C7H85_00920 [Zobellella endophytica]|uniref:Pyrroline-5-carboxylate reductase catalytic N-terminal domain-containing protein n=2 Tax=Zobellella endophytica TaxID=2116700 RepID=A0A2P7RB37_9GAMM|nr:hypothetical protein C7H85_00920 [Zobellella endophytica]
MEIGIIGTSSIGGTIARKLKAAGHKIRVANSKGREGAQHFADEVGATSADMQGAVDGVELVILSNLLPAMVKLPTDRFWTCRCRFSRWSQQS